VLLVAGLNTSTLVWYLSTITTVVHMFRHLHAFYKSRKIHSKLLMNVPEYFTAKQLRELEFTVSQLKEAGFSCKQLKGAGFSCKQLKEECGFSLAQLKEGGFTAQEVGAIMAFSIPDIIAAYNLKKGHQFVYEDPSNQVGQVVFAEGKVGVITDTYGIICCKISYSDGSRNKDMEGNGYLRFANRTRDSDPVETRCVAPEEESAVESVWSLE